MIEKTRIIPDGKKELKHAPIHDYLDPKFLYYPVTSGRCAEGECFVKVGDYVKVGQQIGLRKGAFFEQPIHATVSGKIVGLENHKDQSGKLVECIVVENDKTDTLHKSVIDRTDEEIDALTKEDYINIAKDYGLVGLGGSGFPTYIKFKTDNVVHTIVVNGVECEPYLVSDYELMMGHPEEMIQGLVYAMKASGAKKGVIAIKKKYTEIYERLTETLKAFSNYDIIIQNVGNHYPQGWELDTIKHAIGLKVPQFELTSKYGVLVFNVSTLSSIYAAVKKRKPVLERYFTVSGNGVHNKNFRARIGTMINEMIDIAGGYKDLEIPKVMILGGPMMGSNTTSDQIVMTHTSTSIIVLNEEPRIEEPCIHCAACVYSCPVEIQPVQIMNAFKHQDVEAIKALNVNKCIECGLCSYVCPSKIHLTEYMRQSKRLSR